MKRHLTTQIVFLTFCFFSFFYGCSGQHSEVSSLAKNFLKAAYEKDYEGVKKFMDFEDIIKQFSEETKNYQLITDSELKKTVTSEMLKTICSISKEDFDKAISSLKVDIDQKDQRYATVSYSTTKKPNIALKLEKRKTGWIIINLQ